MPDTATDTEAIVVSGLLAPWGLYGFATNPRHAIRDERSGMHGWAAGGWACGARSKGIQYEYSPGYGQPVTLFGVVPWARVTELVQAAAAPELIVALGNALKAKADLDFLRIEAMWARQRDPEAPSLIADQDAHKRETHRLHWLINDLGEAIRERIRNPEPVGQLDLLTLITLETQ